MASPAALLDALPLAALHLRLGITADQIRPALTVPDFWLSQSHSTIRTQHGVIPFVAFAWQREFVDNITPREMILKSRDVGSSEICVRYLCHRQLRDGGNLLIKADKHDNAKNLISIARHYLLSLPPGERPTLLKDNETELELQGLGTIRAMAQGGGRSERCKYLLKTERAFWQDASEEEAAISGALVAGGVVIQESTANGFNDYHADWVDGQNGYRKTFVGRNANPTHDADWWESKRAELARTGQLIEQEYPATPEEAFVTSGNCLFDVPTLRVQQQIAAAREPIERSDNGAIRIWQRPLVGRRYVAGADVAEGKQAGNNRLDYSVLAIYDWQTCVNVLTLRCQLPPDEFAQQAAALCTQYNRATLGVERNNHGHAVLLMLKQLHYDNIYYHEELIADLQTGKHRNVKTAGWPTTARTKPLLEEGFRSLLASGGLCSWDTLLWDEALSYVRDVNGHTGAQQGCHDDVLMAHMIALQMRNYAYTASDSIVLGRIEVGNGRR